MPAVKTQLKRFEFPVNTSGTYELPPNYIAVQIDEGQTHVVIWAQRNGNA